MGTGGVRVSRSPDQRLKPRTLRMVQRRWIAEVVGFLTFFCNAAERQGAYDLLEGVVFG